MTELTGMADRMDRMENAHDRGPAGMPVSSPVADAARVSLAFSSRTDLGNQRRRNQTLPTSTSPAAAAVRGAANVADLRKMIDERGCRRPDRASGRRLITRIHADLAAVRETFC